MGRFDNQVAFITGGARGQGRSHALALANEGADVALFDFVPGTARSTDYDMPTPEDFKATQNAVEATGRRCLTIQGDVRNTEEVQNAVNRTVSELGGLDIAIANAGIFVLAPAVETTDQMWNDVIDTNLSGVYRTVQAAAKQMSEKGKGRIITISSMAGRTAFPNAVAYTAAKFGVIGLTKTFALELGKDTDITVNAICPTNVNTTMIRDSANAAKLFTGKDNPSEDEIEAGASSFTAQDVPWVEPEDVTEAVLFLAGPGARYITGEALTVSAGQIAQNAA